jgi:hypothetical protein
MNHPLLYEINTRCWLGELSEKHGRRISLDRIPEAEFDEWQRLGFTHIWLMGVWEVCPLSRKFALNDSELKIRYSEALPGWTAQDVGGSPYAIADYNVPTELGGIDGLRQFRKRINAHGIRLILDFIPNHVGLAHSWLMFWPELFVRGVHGDGESFTVSAKGEEHCIAHGKDPYFSAWRDTAQLDLRRSDTQLALTQALEGIASSCDGVRCDMAMLALNEIFAKTWSHRPCSTTPTEQEFWVAALASVRALHPGFEFIAEVYWDLESTLLEIGFDHTYDKWLYDHLLHHNFFEATDHLTDQPQSLTTAGVHFLENHDEERAAAAFDWSEHRPAAILSFCLPGMRMLHEGQLDGARTQIPVQLSRRPLETIDETIHAFYQWLLAALRSTAIGHGSCEILTTRPAWENNDSHANVVAIQWQNSEDTFQLVVINLSPWDAQCLLFPTVKCLHQHHWRLNDLLGEANYWRFGIEIKHKGLYLALTSRDAQILNFSKDD